MFCVILVLLFATSWHILWDLYTQKTIEPFIHWSKEISPSEEQSKQIERDGSLSNAICFQSWNWLRGIECIDPDFPCFLALTSDHCVLYCEFSFACCSRFWCSFPSLIKSICQSFQSYIQFRLIKGDEYAITLTIAVTHVWNRFMICWEDPGTNPSGCDESIDALWTVSLPWRGRRSAWLLFEDVRLYLVKLSNVNMWNQCTTRKLKPEGLVHSKWNTVDSWNLSGKFCAWIPNHYQLENLVRFHTET